MKVLRIVPERCTGCLRCELACSYVQTGTFQPAKSVIRVSPFEGHTSYAPYTCFQCAEGWCMTACPVGAIVISPVGAKAVVDDQCVGCKLCTIACPYGTMFYNPDTQKAFKCNLCGGDPACAHACPTAGHPLRGGRDRRLARRLRGGARRRHARAGRREREALMAARHVIVGGGTAGHNAINTIRQEEGERSEIVLVSAERPYSRMVLPYYLGRTIAESHVFTATPAKLGRLGVTTHIGRRATGARREGREAHARRRHRARVRRPPGRDRVVRRPGAGAGRRRRRGPQLLDARAGARAWSPRSGRAATW